MVCNLVEFSKMSFINTYDVLCYVCVVLHDFYAEITEASPDTMVCKLIWFLAHTEFKCRRLLFLFLNLYLSTSTNLTWIYCFPQKYQPVIPIHYRSQLNLQLDV